MVHHLARGIEIGVLLLNKLVRRNQFSFIVESCHETYNIQRRKVVNLIVLPGLDIIKKMRRN
jgi:hypothetical protein